MNFVNESDVRSDYEWAIREVKAILNSIGYITRDREDDLLSTFTVMCRGIKGRLGSVSVARKGTYDDGGQRRHYVEVTVSIGDKKVFKSSKKGWARADMRNHITAVVVASNQRRTDSLKARRVYDELAEKYPAPCSEIGYTFWVDPDGGHEYIRVSHQRRRTDYKRLPPHLAQELANFLMAQDEAVIAKVEELRGRTYEH